MLMKKTYIHVNDYYLLIVYTWHKIADNLGLINLDDEFNVWYIDI